MHILNDDDCAQKIRQLVLSDPLVACPLTSGSFLPTRKDRQLARPLYLNSVALIIADDDPDGFRYSVDGDGLRSAPNADGMLTGLGHDTCPNTLSAVFIRDPARLETSTAKNEFRDKPAKT
jgi:hypothetical protein